MRHDSGLLKVLVALWLTLNVACARSGSTVVPVAFKPCAMAGVGAVDSSWRQVTAPGFTFCVPGSWGPTGAGSDTLDPSNWTGREGFVRWHLGRPQSMSSQPRRAEITGTVSTGGMSPPPPIPSPATRPDESCPPPANTPFMVDSVAVVVTQAACRGTWTTTAWSTAPEIYVHGEPQSAANAMVLNAIVVTIRFAPVKH